MKYLTIAIINAFLLIGLVGLNLTDDVVAMTVGMTASALISLKLAFW